MFNLPFSKESSGQRREKYRRKCWKTNFTSLRFQSIFHISLFSGFSNLPFHHFGINIPVKRKKETRQKKAKLEMWSEWEYVAKSQQKPADLPKWQFGLINQCSMLLPLTFCQSHNPSFYLLDVMNIQVYLWFCPKKKKKLFYIVEKICSVLWLWNLNIFLRPTQNVRREKWEFFGS